MATDAVQDWCTRAVRKNLLRGGAVVEKSSLVPAGISVRGVESKVGTRSSKGGEVVLSFGYAPKKVDLALAKRLEYAEEMEKDVERQEASLVSRRALCTSNPAELRHRAGCTSVGVDACGHALIWA